jgi:phosphate transport system permease protein
MTSKQKDKIWTGILYVVSIFVVILLVILIGLIFYKGRNALNLSFLFGNPKVAEAGGGIAPMLFNSFYMLIVSLLITIPLGVGAGIFLAEYAKEGRLTNVIRLCIETLASLPSIVVGLFGLLVFVKMTGWGFSVLAGAMAIALINFPSLTRVSEDAIRAASASVKEASLGLGATTWQTIAKLIIPVAMPQILTGVIIASGRIFGESAALLFTAGMSAPPMNFNSISLVNATSPFSLFRPAETLSVYIWKLNSEGMVPDAADIANKTSAVLVMMVLIFNVSSRVLGKKIHQKYSGKN